MSTGREMAALLAEEVSRRGLSQRQFADLVGQSAKHINLVLNGRVGARPNTLDAWAAALHMRFAVALEHEPSLVEFA